MSTQHDIENEREALSRVSPLVQDQQVSPAQAFPQPPPRPPSPKPDRWVVITAIVVMLVLVLSLGAIFIPGLIRAPGPAPTPTPTSPAIQVTPTAPTTPVPTPIPGADVAPTPAPGIVLGPQACPSGINSPAHWNAIIGTNNGERQVESISCANIMGNPSLQSLVLVRHTNATLDVYVFTSITNAKPARIFLLPGLVKGDAKISGYNTVMTAEVDKNSTLNAGKSVSAMTPDLFREFDWSAEENTLVQTAFPGIFPDLTRYQAEADNANHQPWKDDPQAVAKELAKQFFDWNRAITTKLLSGGGSRDVYATVRVQEAPVQGGQSQGPSVYVTLSRLEGNTHNIWVAIAVEDGTMLTLTNIDARSLITSPVTLQGTGAAFEAVIGRAVVYDHLYNDAGNAQIKGDLGMGQANYTTKFVYATTFRAGPQEGVVAVYEANGGLSEEIYTAVMRKVLLNPEPGVALGEIACPSAVSNPAYWTAFISAPPNPGVAERVACGNLLGKPSVQAMVIAREIIGNTTGNPIFRSVFVFDNITASQPKLLFKVGHMMYGDAQISGYSTVITAEVDPNSAINKGKPDAKLTPDLFREFDWADGAGKFVQVAFPGIFPDLTRYQAEADQARVNHGQDTWKNDPAKVAKALAAQFFGWKRTLTTTVLSGGGSRDVDATVQVQEALAQGPPNQGPSVIVTLSRLQGNTHNMWVAIAVKDGSALTLTNIQPRSLISSPVKLEGKGDAFENTIGMAYILDHLYTKVGQAIVTGPPGVGMGNVPYSTQVSYDTSFKQGTQEGIVEVALTSPIGDAPAVMVKVLLDPQPRVAQGPVSCPLATQQPGYWESVLGIDTSTGGIGTVSCGNLKGDPSLQALVPVYYTNGQPGAYYIYDHITDAHPVQLFKLQTKSAMISGVSTVITADVDPNSSINKGKSADQMTTDLYREFQWSGKAGTFVQVAFPGLFPDLTRWQAEDHQAAVMRGDKGISNFDAVTTAQKLLGGTAKLVKGGGSHDLTAVVNVTFPEPGSPTSIPVTQVTLNRLEGNPTGIWEITAVESDGLFIYTPKSGTTISSPVTVTGFGPQFEAQVGTVYILDRLYHEIQVGNNFAMLPDGSSPPAKFTLDVPYKSSIKESAQEGIVKLVHTSGASFDIRTVMVKVLLNP
jgi:hypothetical protein